MNLYRKLLLYIQTKFFIFKKNEEKKRIYNLLPNYEKYLFFLTNGDSIGTKKFPWREKDIIFLLNKYKPKNIIELGSGSSTFIFSQYCKEKNSKLLSVDESKKWLELTKNALNINNLLPNTNIVLKESFIEKNSKGNSYQITLPKDIDLIYIDGPTDKVDGKRKPNLDILKLFNKSIFPKIIAIDVRFKTVLEIFKSPHSSKYKFIPSTFFLCRQNINPFNFIYFGRLYYTCIFIRKY